MAADEDEDQTAGQAEAAEPVENGPAPALAATGDDAGAEATEAAPEAEPPAPVVSAFRYDEKFYGPISPDSPTGKAVEFYHFSEMEQELAWPLNDFGRPDAGQRPNFRAVRDMALEFLNGTGEIKAVRDVRPLLALTIAETGDKGPVGLARTLDLFVATVTEFWEKVHPQQEDEDDDEYFDRMEELRKFFNPAIFSLAVEGVGIGRSPRVGDLTTRTFGIAAGKLSPREGEFAPNADALHKILADEEELHAKIVEAHAAYLHAIDRLETFTAFLEARPEVDPLDLSGVVEAVRKQAAFLEPYVGGTAPSGDGGDAVPGGPEEGGQAAAPSASMPVSGANTLEEAMDLIDDILIFYARRGRSSPVPLGLIALRDLIAGDFNTWLSRTAPSGLGEAGIVISEVDASRLSAFASGEVPAAAAPREMPELDFEGIDKAIYEAETAFAALDNAVYQHQQTLPPGEEGEENTTLSAEVQAIRAALDLIFQAKVELQQGPEQEEENAGSSENASGGDGRHSRITDRNGVKQSLDAIAAYFEREEPSSPAPAYLRRLKSLVDARFTEIARELMPEEGGEAKLRLEPRTKLR